ncbi:MAG TPA: hypothetical protein VME43_18690 [Bryobacteraceae bacterium]|nr:hypothetical protein [Bryobacteraceae bacterium]
MSCPDWESRILLLLEGVADAEAAGHLRNCPACAAFASELAGDAQALRTAPPEAAAVDYAAIRVAARREAVRRIWRRRVLAALAVAAAILLASRVAIHRDLPQPAHSAPVRPPAAVVASVAPAQTPAPAPTPRPAIRPARHHRPTDADLDRQFAEYLRHVEESQHPAAADWPAVVPIATSNPNVTIIWLQESKGNDHE